MPTPAPTLPDDDDAPLPPSPVGAMPEQLHLALTKMVGEMRVSFTTMAGGYIRDGEIIATVAAAAAAPRVAVATVRYGTSAGTLDKIATGNSSTYRDDGWAGLLHTVLLRGLAPNTTYFYRAAYNGVDAPDVSSFISAAAPGTLGAGGLRPLIVAVVADLGSASPQNPRWREPGAANATIAALSAGAAARSYDLLLHAGDLAYTSGTQSIWDTFMRQMEPAVSRIPYMVCPGNHEHWYNFSGYRHRFDMPGPLAPRTRAPEATASAGGDHGAHNLWYSFDAGGVHFVAISSEHDLRAGSTQHAWLSADLAAARAGADWIVVFGHRPLYCSSKDTYDCGAGLGMGALKMRDGVEELFDAWGVELYLTGHVHMYERTLPVINNSAPVTNPSTAYVDASHTTHVVVGMAGDNEGLTDGFVAAPPAWSLVRHAELGWARLTVGGDGADKTLLFEYVLSASGEIFDQFELRKTK